MSTIGDQLLKLGLVEQKSAEQLVREGRVRGKTGGRKRFYYESRDGRVLYLLVSDEVAAALGAAKVAVAEAPDGKVTLVEAGAAASVREMDASWIRTPPRK